MVDSATELLTCSLWQGTLEQKLMNWVMEGPWMETIVPAIPKLFDKALTEAVSSISDGISGMVIPPLCMCPPPPVHDYYVCT